MRLATITDDGGPTAALVADRRLLPLAGSGIGLDSVRAIAAGGDPALERLRAWADRQPDRAYRSLAGAQLGPVVPDPGAIYTIGLNYPPASGPPVAGARPLVYGKAPTSVGGAGATVSWDRSLTASVDPEVELGVVIGTPAEGVEPEAALDHVLGYTCLNDISSRDPWLDGDQWLLGKSFAGFCPVGPWLVTPDELDPADLRLGCILNGVPIQGDTTARMRHTMAEVIAYISRHTALRPGDLIAMGTPARLAGPVGPERHLEAGDVVTVWIEQVGELTTVIG